MAKDVDWEALGKGYELAGGSIKQAVVRAATQAALRIEVYRLPKMYLSNLQEGLHENTTARCHGLLMASRCCMPETADFPISSVALLL